MIKVDKLPVRVFRSPLVEYANFIDGSHINLIRIHKPYANGIIYAIHDTTNDIFADSGLFTSYNEAKRQYKLMVRCVSISKKLIKQGKTNN